MPPSPASRKKRNEERSNEITPVKQFRCVILTSTTAGGRHCFFHLLGQVQGVDKQLGMGDSQWHFDGWSYRFAPGSWKSGAKEKHVQVHRDSKQQIHSLNVAPSSSYELLVSTFAFLWIIHSLKWLGRWFMRMLLGLLGDLCLYKQPCWMCPIGAHAGLHEHLWHFPFLQAFK